MRTALSDDAMHCWDCKKRSQQKASTQMCQMRLHSTHQKSQSPDPAITAMIWTSLYLKVFKHTGRNSNDCE